jgi:DNA polymerase-1
LFDKLGLPARKKTPTGKASTAENVLEDLAFDYELPKFILEYRSLAKLRSTYIEALPLQIDAKTGRVHTSYQQAVASTGRLSSSDPNLQNIPIRTEEGRKIRQAFVAPKDYVLVAADYSQIELRIMAHLSSDAGLISAFEKGLDVHKATAAEMHGWRVEDVTSEQRRAAKAINFGLIYGMSAYGLAKQLGIPAKEAQALVDMYFKKYPGVLEYMQNTRALAHQQGFVETLFGRRLYLPDINSSNKMMQQASERAAINAPMQGTAADIIKRAMIALDTALPLSKLRATMVMQVHDELVFECHQDDVAALKILVKKEMESAADLKVPLIVDVGVGANWDEAH